MELTARGRQAHDPDNLAYKEKEYLEAGHPQTGQESRKIDYETDRSERTLNASLQSGADDYIHLVSLKCH